MSDEYHRSFNLFPMATWDALTLLQSCVRSCHYNLAPVANLIKVHQVHKDIIDDFSEPVTVKPIHAYIMIQSV